MSHSQLLRQTRAGSVINTTSKGQEKEVRQALREVEQKLKENFPTIQLQWESKKYLKDIVAQLKSTFPNVEFFYYYDSSFITPDGGFLSLIDHTGKMYPIVIAEVKNQGTNDKRLSEGKTKQALGNAIERLGKNVIGLRSFLLNENIFPFVCFGYGCDFAEGSSILDRVVTICMFGKLNTIYLYNQPPFNRGSYYFRAEYWTIQEMADIMYKIAERSIYYYFSKYGKDSFDT